jgi:FkbM family methyltransferase
MAKRQNTTLALMAPHVEADDFRAPQRAMRALPATDALKAELSDALRLIEPVIDTARGERWLLMPGHHPIRDPVLRTRNGLKAWLGPNRVYEEASTVLLSFLLARTNISVFFDVGSAKGHFTRLAASRVSKAPKVYSFEMMPEAATAQRRLLDRDLFGKNAIVNDVALTDTHVGDTHVWTARSSLFEERPPRAAYQESWYRRLKFWLRGEHNRGLKSAEVMLTSLDKFAQTAGVIPDLIKIDVEGYELKVLKGAESMLSRHHPMVILELHTDKKQRFGATRSQVVNYLFDRGYRSLLLTSHQDRLACSAEEVLQCDHSIICQETNHYLFIHDTMRLPSQSFNASLQIVS